jgi:putative transposase
LEENVWVSFVNPAYSSQRCFNCNKIDRQSRVGQKFHCVGCGHQANADINAAKNLAWMGREKIYSLRSAKVPLKELNF